MMTRSVHSTPVPSAWMKHRFKRRQARVCVRRRPQNPLISLDDAARLICPSGALTAKSLRTEHAKGSLKATMLAGKLLTRLSWVEEMIERGARHGCQDQKR